MNKGLEKALTEGIQDLLRFMHENPKYTDINWIHFNTNTGNKAEMQVRFANGYFELRSFDENGVE